MADTTFLPSIVPARTGRQHAWYKERLCMKCGKGVSSAQVHGGGVNARGWRFLQPGLDDFRSGYPPPAGGQPFTLPQSGALPAWVRGTPPGLTKEQACFSRESPQQQAHRRLLAQVEQALTQHPLALYSHYQECLSPELFDQVTSILDPEMSIKTEDASVLMDSNRDPADDHAEHNKNKMLEASLSNGGINPKPPNKLRAERSAVKNPYFHIKAKEDSTKDDHGMSGTSAESPSFNEEVKRVTKQLHDWVVSLDGGESGDLTESSMFRLLASAFEMKPAVNFPKQRRSRKQPQGSLEHLNRAAKPIAIPLPLDSPEIHPDKAKMNYGSMFRDYETAKTRNRGGAMPCLPPVNKDAFSPGKLNQEVAQSYTAQAYKKFIASRGLKEPEFLGTLHGAEPENLLNPEADMPTDAHS